MGTLLDLASLVMIPSGYKDDKLYSVKPTDGSGDFTFSRDGSGASPATRVNASGLIEKGRTNELTYSNDFSNWTSANTTETSGQSGYDGTNDAWLLSKAASAGNIQLSVSTSGVNTFSYYAKAGTLNWTRLLILGSTNASTYINLSDGSIGVGGGGFIDATATSVGGGWYRVSITHSTAITQVRIYPADADDDTSGTSGNIYIQDAQLESGLISTSYIETTTAPVSAGLLGDMPRLDYSGGATCPSLLLEASRVNSVTQSEYISSWYLTNATATANDDISPEGVRNATKIVATAGGIDVKQTSINVTASTTYTFTFYCKLTSGTALEGRFYDNTNGANIEVYDYTSQLTIGEWARVERTFTTPVGCTNIQVWLLANAGTNVTAHYFGAQLEAGSYPTSYIPTYGSASTRGADDVNEITGFTSNIGQTEGTLFLDFVANDEDSLQIAFQVRTTGSTNVGQVDIRMQSGLLRALGADAGVSQFNISAGAVTAGTRYKCAVRYKENDVAFYVNGSLAGTDTSASFSSSALQQVGFNENTGTFLPSASIKQALIFPTALTNAELAALTA